MYIRKTAWRIANALSTLTVWAAIFLTGALVGVRLLGLQPLTVLSGSMEPAYPVGSLIYIRPVDPGTLQAGDVITFRLEGGRLATHRIAQVTQEGFLTKGDANNARDAVPVQPSQVVGMPVMTIPGLGYLVGLFSGSPLLCLAALAAAAGSLLLSELLKSKGAASSY